MKPHQPVRWPCYIWWKDELKPRRKYLLFGPRNQGKRMASNYLGFLIVAKKGTPSWTIEQEKYECRYWVTHFWRLVDFYWFHCYLIGYMWRHQNTERFKCAAAHLARVECASRAQEIRARVYAEHKENIDTGWFDEVDVYTICLKEATFYARSIHGAKNYPFIKAAGWTEDDCHNEIVKHL